MNTFWSNSEHPRQKTVGPVWGTGGTGPYVLKRYEHNLIMVCIGLETSMNTFWNLYEHPQQKKVGPVWGPGGTGPNVLRRYEHNLIMVCTSLETSMNTFWSYSEHQAEEGGTNMGPRGHWTQCCKTVWIESYNGMYRFWNYYEHLLKLLWTPRKEGGTGMNMKIGKKNIFC